MTGMKAVDILIPGICGFGLHLRLDGFRLIYTLIAVLMWSVSGVFSGEYMAHYERKMRYYVFFWITFLATVGVFLSENLYTTFIFFEIMSFTSYVWVAFDEKKESLRAAETYLAVAVIGGMVMLMGLFLLYDLLGTLEIDELREAAAAAAAKGCQARLYASGVLLLFGFGAKAGCFPLHIWLPKAHPVAPAPASALLSGILTKTGVFGIIAVTCGMFGTDAAWGLLIVTLGLITMFLGALLAIFSINLKRTLACSSVSQIGFILVGVGMSSMLASAGGNPSIAARGAFLHMVNHSLFKLVLFLCAGAVFMNLHQLDLNEIRGFGRKKPLLAGCFLMGALGISGIPGWSGYVSKTLLHESIVEYRELIAEGTVDGIGGWISRLAGSSGLWAAAEWIFLITGGMTVSYMLKLFFALFIEKHGDAKRQAEFDNMSGQYMRGSSAFVLAVPAVMILAMGMAPYLIMDRLADMGQGFFLAEGMEYQVHYFSFANLKGGLISIGIGILLYALVIRTWLMTDQSPVRTGKEAGTQRQSGSQGRQNRQRPQDRQRQQNRQRPQDRQRHYVDRWPRGLDLENLVYRPVLQVLLPGICNAVLGFIDKYLISAPVTVFLAISSVVCRGMDHLADGIILLARRTTHRQVKEIVWHAEDYRLARWLGRTLDNLGRLCIRKRNSRTADSRSSASAVMESRIPGLVRLEEAILRNGRLVEESFSFGLMLFCIGLCLTLGYLLLAFIRG